MKTLDIQELGLIAGGAVESYYICDVRDANRTKVYARLSFGVDVDTKMQQAIFGLVTDKFTDKNYTVQLSKDYVFDCESGVRVPQAKTSK